MIATELRENDFRRTIQARPAADSRETRIGRILGSTRPGCLPQVTRQSLGRYHDYLQRHLRFPFRAEFHDESQRGALRRVTVHGLVDPRLAPGDVSAGVLCRTSLGGRETTVPLAELELPEDDPNARLIDDYWYWAWNWR
jgi:hypothetical protein